MCEPVNQGNSLHDQKAEQLRWYATKAEAAVLNPLTPYCVSVPFAEYQRLLSNDHGQKQSQEAIRDLTQKLRTATARADAAVEALHCARRAIESGLSNG